MHAEADGARCVTIAEQFGDLAVSHNAAARDAPDHCVNSLAVFWIGLFQVLRTTRAGPPSPRLLLKRNGKQISSYRPAGTSLRFRPSRMTTPCDSSARCVGCFGELNFSIDR